MRAVIAITRNTFKEIIRKKDFYVLFVLLIIAIGFFFQESFFNVSGTSRYLKDIGYSAIIIFSVIITVIFSARQIPSEIEAKTIYPLLAKPVSRGDFIAGKFLGAYAISVFSFTSFFTTYAFFIFLKSPKDIQPALLLEAYALTLMMLGLLGALTIFFSLILTVSANITISFLLYFTLAIYNGSIYSSLAASSGFMSHLNNLIYYMLPHFEFYDMKIRVVHSWDALPPWVMWSILAYTLIYVAMVLVTSTVLFKKKSL